MDLIDQTGAYLQLIMLFPKTKEISDNFLIFGIGRIFYSMHFTEPFYSIV